MQKLLLVQAWKQCAGAGALRYAAGGYNHYGNAVVWTAAGSGLTTELLPLESVDEV